MHNTPLFEKIQCYLESETNRKLRIRLAELEADLIERYPQYQSAISKAITDHSYVVKTPLRLDPERKNRKKADIPDEQRCHARTGSGAQCRRPRTTTGENYCLSHKNKLTHGNINSDASCDHELSESDAPKRGRRKNKTADGSTLDHSLYVQAALTDISGIPYLIDENLVIYKQGKNIIVGYVNSNSEVCWI